MLLFPQKLENKMYFYLLLHVIIDIISILKGINRKIFKNS